MNNKEYNFMVYHNTFEYNEVCFFNRTIDLIINYPSLWHNFVENVLKNKVILMSEGNILIVSLGLITGSLREAFDKVYEIMNECGVIISINNNRDFLIIYLNSKNVSEFFRNTGFWLEYLTANAFLELGINAYRGVVIKTSDDNIQEVDVFIDLQNILFLIECKDTYIYDERDFKKMFDLQKKIEGRTFGIFVVTKMLDDLDYNLHGIDIIKYNYNYFEFKENLKEIIISKLISISF